MSEDKLTLLLAVVPGVPARGIVLCRVHERLIGRGCRLAVFLTDLIDKGKDLCSDLQVICVISSCCRPTFVNIGYRDRKTALFAVCRNYEILAVPVDFATATQFPAICSTVRISGLLDTSSSCASDG